MPIYAKLQEDMPPAKTDGPKYSELIKAALLGLKDRNGSSLAAIKKYLAANFPAAKNDVALKNALKFGVSKGMFIKVKASFKLSPDAKKKTSFLAKKTATKPSTAKKLAKKEKKAPGPYMVFCKEMRPKILAKSPGMAFGEVGKALGAAWGKLSDAEKAGYTGKASSKTTPKKSKPAAASSKSKGKPAKAKGRVIKKKSLSKPKQAK